MVTGSMIQRFRPSMAEHQRALMPREYGQQSKHTEADVNVTIDIDRVRQLLMWHWHDVIPGTLELGPYMYAGQDKVQFPATVGATWRERNESGHERIIFCPLASIKAVSYGWESTEALHAER
jgi:hypothetical protein